MDQIDRAFFQGISTVRALSAEGLPRPPAHTRSELYGLYKQATEGNIRAYMHRPGDEDPIAQEKWDSWKGCEGLHQTEAKKRYIALLLETMRDYATGTKAARDLLNDLESAWDQVRDIPTRDASPVTPAFLQRPSTLIPPGMTPSPANIKTTSADLDNAELRQWKREVSRTMDALNDQVYSLKNQVSELSERQANYRRKIMSVLRPLFGFMFRVVRHVAIDLFVIVMLLYMVRYARRRPELPVNRNINQAVRLVARARIPPHHPARQH